MQLLSIFPQILIILEHRMLGREKHYSASIDFINKARCSLASSCSKTINLGRIQPNIKTALNLCFFFHLQKSLYIINNQDNHHPLYFIIIIVIVTIIILTITTSSIIQTYTAKLAIIHALQQMQ